MYYVLPDSFLEKLYSIRKDYEKRSGLKLDGSSQPCAVSSYFGAKDNNTRSQQIKFIENWLISLAADLKPQLVFANENEIQNHIKALSILVAVCVFTISKIDSSYIMRKGSNSILQQLLSEALQLQKDNQLDIPTRNNCLLEARSLITPYFNAASINRSLETLFSECEWQEFRKFLKTELKHDASVNPYPITTIMMPLFATPMKLAGYSTGYVLGDMLGKSTQLLDNRYTLTATISSNLYFVMRSSFGMGALLLTPVYASKLLDAYCGVSMAWLLGTIMNIVGNGVGFGIGMTLDAGSKLLFNACSLIKNAIQSEARFPQITGFTLVDTQRIVDGIELKLIDTGSSPINGLVDLPCQKQIIFDVQKDGIFLQIGDETAIIPWDTHKIPNIKELQLKLAEKNLLIINQKENNNACSSLF